MNSRLENMTANDIDEAVELIKIAMNEDEAAWARKTMKSHFGCVKHKLVDGRNYFLWRENEKIIGVVGLHNYIWGPEENVWLSWFAVDPNHHGKGFGSRLLIEVEKVAVEMGYKKFFIETYDSFTFDKARSFYKEKGFVEVGKVSNYLPDGSAMIVYAKELCKQM